MTLDNARTRAYLFELYTMTQGDIDARASMYDVGEALGLEKAEAGTMAEDLFIQGLAELKTLSGGIGITSQGLEALDIKAAPKTGSETLTLGDKRVLEDRDRKTVEKMLRDIKADIAHNTPAYEQVEELVMDVKTIEVQMLSPNPKTDIIREIFKSLNSNIGKSGSEELAAKLAMLVTS